MPTDEGMVALVQNSKYGPVPQRDLCSAPTAPLHGLTPEQQVVFAESVWSFGSLDEVKVSLAALQAEKSD